MSGNVAVSRGSLFLALVAAAVMSLSAAVPAVSAEKAGGPAWMDYEQGLAKAKKEGKVALADFFTTWCRDCKKMDKTTLADPEVAKTLSEKLVAVRVDGDKRKDIAGRYGIGAFPTFCLIGPDGKVIYQYIGYISTPDFMLMLEYAHTGAYKTAGFKEYYKSRKK